MIITLALIPLALTPMMIPPLLILPTIPLIPLISLIRLHHLIAPPLPLPLFAIVRISAAEFDPKFLPPGAMLLFHLNRGQYFNP